MVTGNRSVVAREWGEGKYGLQRGRKETRGEESVFCICVVLSHMCDLPNLIELNIVNMCSLTVCFT